MSVASTAPGSTQASARSAVEERAGWVRPLAWAGIIGPVLFTVAFLAQEAFRRNEYDPLAEVVSALEAGPNGWVQQLNFVVFGLATLAFAIGLHRGVRPTRAGIVGRRCSSSAASG